MLGFVWPCRGSLSETRSLLAHGGLWAGVALQARPSVLFTWVLPTETDLGGVDLIQAVRTCDAF